MEIDRKELKRQARERMALTDPKFWMVALAYLAMTTGVSWLISFLPLPANSASAVPFLDVQLFFQLLLLLYTTVVQFGLCLWALWTWRQLDPGAGSLMQGFSVAGRVLLMELDILLRTLGWYIAASLILTFPFFFLFLLLVDSLVTLWLFYFLFAASLVIALLVISLRYALSPYLLADRPDEGSHLPVRRSVELMRGWKMELFKLEFSFFGWMAINFLLSAGVLLFFLHQAGLLAPAAIPLEAWLDQVIDVVYSAPVVILRTLITVPVSLWLIPYRSTARAGFYDARLQAASQERFVPPEMPPL